MISTHLLKETFRSSYHVRHGMSDAPLDHSFPLSLSYLYSVILYDINISVIQSVIRNSTLLIM